MISLLQALFLPFLPLSREQCGCGCRCAYRRFLFYCVCEHHSIEMKRDEGCLFVLLISVGMWLFLQAHAGGMKRNEWILLNSCVNCSLVHGIHGLLPLLSLRFPIHSSSIGTVWTISTQIPKFLSCHFSPSERNAPLIEWCLSREALGNGKVRHHDWSSLRIFQTVYWARCLWWCIDNEGYNCFPSKKEQTVNIANNKCLIRAVCKKAKASTIVIPLWFQWWSR